jgi:hypothetical protein
VPTDVITDQFAYYLKLTKLLDDDRRENSLLVKTVKKLLDTISNNRGKLKHVATWFWDLVETDQKRQLLVQCAIDGFRKAGIFSIIAHGRFTFDQLVKSAPNAKSSESQGVYVCIYIAKELMISAELSEFVIGRRVRPEKSKAFDGKRKEVAKQRR